MNNKFLTHKFLPIISIFLLVFYILCVPVLGANNITEPTQSMLDVVVSNNYYAVAYGYIGNDFYICAFLPTNSNDTALANSKDSFFLIDKVNNIFLNNGAGTYGVETRIFYFKDGSYISCSNSYNHSFLSDECIRFTFNNFSSIVKRINPTTNKIEEVENFFILTPPGITQTLLVEAIQVQIMKQLTTMIAGFLKYLIVLVISVIAFLKGWKFLSTLLRKV